MLITVHNIICIFVFRVPPVSEPQELSESSSSSDSETPDSPLDVSGRIYPLKPRPVLQRRNTITGTTPTSKRPYPDIEHVSAKLYYKHTFEF